MLHLHPAPLHSTILWHWLCLNMWNKVFFAEGKQLWVRPHIHRHLDDIRTFRPLITITLRGYQSVHKGDFGKATGLTLPSGDNNSKGKMWPTWKILPGKCWVASARCENALGPPHTTWQITLGSLHLIIHFNARLIEEAEAMEKCIILSSCFVTFFLAEFYNLNTLKVWSPPLVSGW